MLPATLLWRHDPLASQTGRGELGFRDLRRVFDGLACLDVPMNAFVVSGLVKRRAQLAGDIEKAHESLRRMVIDLENLDQTILQFEPDFKVETIQPKAFRPPKDWSNRGQMSRICLSILRQASEPLTCRDIALQLLTERALNREDQKLLRLMTKRVGVSLRGQRENGVVKSDQGPGQYMLWALVR